MLDLVTALLLALVVVGLCVWATEGTAERTVIRTALVTKCLASVASVAVWAFYYRGQFVNDNFTYHDLGTASAADVRSDTLDTLLHQIGAMLNPGAQTLNTDRFTSLSTVLHILTGDSFTAASLICGLLAFLGQLMLYRTFAGYFPEQRVRRWWQFGMLFFPTLVFWSAGLFKDSLGIFGLGLAVWGTYRFLRGQPLVSSMLLTLAGFSCLALFRGQVLPVLLVSEVPWLGITIAEKRRGAVALIGLRTFWREGSLLGAILLCFAGVAIAGRIEPRLSLSALPRAIVNESQDYLQNQDKIAGGSTLRAALVTDPTWRGLVRAWPRALARTLLRPFPWEASSATSMLAAIENGFLLLLFARTAWLVWRAPGALARAAGSPIFIASVVFVALFGLGVGTSTLNLGTISRYRIPLIPFLMGAVIIVMDEARRPRRCAESLAR